MGTIFRKFVLILVQNQTTSLTTTLYYIQNVHKLFVKTQECSGVNHTWCIIRKYDCIAELLQILCDKSLIRGLIKFQHDSAIPAYDPTWIHHNSKRLKNPYVNFGVIRIFWFFMIEIKVIPISDYDLR